MSKLYIIRQSDGTAEAVDSIREAATIILAHDLHDFEIRPDESGAGFWLWRSRFGGGGRNGGMVKHLIYSAAPNEESAEAEIFAQVVKKSDLYGFDVLNADEFASLAAVE